MEHPRPVYKLSPIPLNEEQELHVKEQSQCQERSIAVIVRRLIDEDIKLKKSEAA